MKQPNATAYLFGNPICLLGSILALLFTGISALSGGSGWLAIAALIAVGYCVNCSRQVSAYKAWKREWDGMGNKTPKQPLHTRHPWLRYALGGIAWLIGAWMALTVDSSLQLVAALFWLVSLAGIGVLIFKATKRAQPVPVQKQTTVTVCVGVPLQSVTASEIYRALPEYCLRLLRK